MVPPFDDSRPSRRRFLRASGATLATGLSALGAGCSGLPPLGSEVRYGSVDTPAAGDPTYRQWLPAPAVLPDDPDDYHVGVYVPDDGGGDHENTSIARSLIAYSADYAGLHLDDADLAFVGSSVAGLLGDVDVDAARDALADTRYERDGSYAGFDLFSRSDTRRVVGVRDGQVLCANGDGGRAQLRAFVDARRGEAPRYVDRDADFAALTGGVGLRRWGLVHPGSTGYLTPGEWENGDGVKPAGWGTAFDDDDRGVYFVETFLYPEGTAVTERDLKRRLDERGRAVESVAVDVAVDGRVATVAMHMTHDRYRDETGGEPLQAPHVTWGVTSDADADRLTFHHEAGDAVQSDWVRVEGTGGAAITSLDGVGSEIAPGDDLTVSTAEFDDDATVRLVYQVPDGTASTTLFNYDLP